MGNNKICDSSCRSDVANLHCWFALLTMLWTEPSLYSTSCSFEWWKWYWKMNFSIAISKALITAAPKKAPKWAGVGRRWRQFNVTSGSLSYNRQWNISGGIFFERFSQSKKLRWQYTSKFSNCRWLRGFLKEAVASPTSKQTMIICKFPTISHIYPKKCSVKPEVCILSKPIIFLDEAQTALLDCACQ